MKKSTFILKPLILSVLLILIMFINVTRLLAIDPPTTGSKKWAEDQPFALALSTKDLFNWKPGDNKIKPDQDKKQEYFNKQYNTKEDM